MFRWITRSRSSARDQIMAGMFLVLLLGLGTAGYVWIEQWSPMDGLYMTFLTLTTIGFNEVDTLSTAGRLFTMVVGMLGFGTFALIATRTAQFVINSQRLQFRRMENQIKKLSGHYILCGYGRIGSRMAADFSANGIPFVIIETNPAKIARLEETDMLFVEGDAEEESTLEKAGLLQAKGVILSLPEDSMNVFVALLAREVNPGLFILARASKPENRRRLIRAGADKVISPYEIGAHRMSQVILTPNVVRFMENVLRDDDLELSMEEIMIPENAAIAGKSLAESNLRQHFDVIVVGIIRNPSGLIEFNPGASGLLNVGDIMIVLGNPLMIKNLRDEGCKAI